MKIIFKYRIKKDGETKTLGFHGSEACEVVTSMNAKVYNLEEHEVEIMKEMISNNLKYALGHPKFHDPKFAGRKFSDITVEAERVFVRATVE
jgi:hypothetical protein